MIHPVTPGTPDIVAIFESEESPLLRYACGLVRRREVAEELVQEAFLRLHRQWEQITTPRPWLYRCVRNLALNHLRDHRKESLEPDSADTPGEEQPDKEAGRNEAVGLVRMLITELTEEDRTLIQLKYHDDLKYSEISLKTGLSVSNVGYRLHHLLKSLADSLRHSGIQNSQG